ncbi:hypothetical protein GQ600_24315 [Phytophthora cactorum]|nr:hypothetical protein GQ600_24315 [Phytophthora cactorum]
MERNATEDQVEDEDEDLEEEREVLSDFSFDVDPDDGLFDNRDGDGGAMRVGSDAPSASSLDRDTSGRGDLPSIGDAGDLGVNAISRVLGRVRIRYYDTYACEPLKKTTALNKKLEHIETSSNNMGGNIFEMLMFLREENERRAEVRRADDDLRHHDKNAAREALFLADKAEAEERRRHDKLEVEER